ncbi:MAG: hypothetical protein JNK34_06315 [Tabrizicola sp.]|nr:hypothetical protein [Tabrizicola sp.]
MIRMPNALDLLDAWWAVPETKRKEAMAQLFAMQEAGEARPDAANGSAADLEPQAGTR